MQANLGRAEALLRSGLAFLYGALEEAWQVVSDGSTLNLAQRATLWRASTHAANTAKEATELMFSAGGSASPYVSSGLERCVRDIHAAAQHLTSRRNLSTVSTIAYDAGFGDLSYFNRSFRLTPRDIGEAAADQPADARCALSSH